MNGRDENGKPIITYERDYNTDGGKSIMLAHSCDEWIIGSLKEAREFIAQLTEIIEKSEQEELNTV